MSETQLSLIKPADLPAPPETAIQVMRACSQKTVNNEELAQLSKNDPMLSAELLRVANSPFFSHGGSVQSITRAIQVLGQRSLRNMALCLSVRDALKECTIHGFDLSLYWEDALRLGVCARLLGELAGLDKDDCFTAGLLQDFGLLVLYHIYPHKGKHAKKLRDMGPAKRLTAEKKIFGIGHDQVIAELAASWSLPEELTKALEYHHQRTDASQSWATLSRILHEADWLSALYRAKNKSPILSKCQKLFKIRYGFDSDKTEEHIATIPTLTEEAATALGLYIEKQTDFAEILRVANLRVIQNNITYQKLNWKLQKAIREKNILTAELQRELSLAREVQKSLLPLPRKDNFPIHGINVSAKYLSGDFYDYLSLPDGRLLFNLGDVSGKGTNAALFMTKTNAVFRCLGQRIVSPAAILDCLNSELCSITVRGMFVTMTAGLYDPASGELTLANAGHMPSLLIQPDGVTKQFPAQAPPLGVMPGQTYSDITVALGNGSLYLYSDGVTEGIVGEGQALETAGMIKLLIDNRNLPPGERLEKVVQTLQKKPLRDDVTMLVVENVH